MDGFVTYLLIIIAIIFAILMNVAGFTDTRHKSSSSRLRSWFIVAFNPNGRMIFCFAVVIVCLFTVMFFNV